MVGVKAGLGVVVDEAFLDGEGFEVKDEVMGGEDAS